MWEQDLKEGEEVEGKFANLLFSKGYVNTFRTEGKTKYDIISINPKTDQLISFEVKYDRMCSETGNVAIEVAYNGKPNSISLASCKYVVYYVEEKFYSIDSVILSWLLKDKDKVKGGDDNKSDLVLLSMKEFKEIFDRV